MGRKTILIFVISISGCANPPQFAPELFIKSGGCVEGAAPRGWVDNSLFLLSATCSRHGAIVRYVQPSGADPAMHGLRVELTASNVLPRSWTFQVWRALTIASGECVNAVVTLRSDRPVGVTIMVRRLAFPYTPYGVRHVVVTSTGQIAKLDAVAPASMNSASASATDALGLFVTANDAANLAIESATWETSACSDAAALSSERIERTSLGIHIHRGILPNWPPLTPAIGTQRLWDTEGAAWRDANPARGRYDFRRMDQWVSAAEARGVQLVMTLGGNLPAWASDQPQEAGAYGPGSGGLPAGDAEWTAWVTAVSTRYRGRIRYWEIWNEPYQNRALADTRILVDLARRAHRILKDVDPENQILSPSMDAQGIYLEKFLASGGGETFDILSVHLYEAGFESPEALFWRDRTVERFRAAMMAHGIVPRPIWNTEFGYGGRMEEREAIGRLARMLILGWLTGVERQIYYAADTDGEWLSLVRDVSVPRGGRNYQPTAAGKAIGELADWIVNARALSLQIDASATWTVHMQLGNGRTGRIVWNSMREVDIGLDRREAIRDLEGHVAREIPSIVVGAVPVFISR